MSKNDQAVLSVQAGPNSGMTIPVSGSALIMGRGTDNDVDVDDKTVSRRHAAILKSASGYFLRDLDSANGTYINGELNGKEDHPLRHGDTIRLAGGEDTFIFRQKDEETVKIDIERPETEDGPEEQLGEEDAELLTLLESNRGAAVSRDDIETHLWPDLAEDDVQSKRLIDRAVLRIRAHLHDDPRRPKSLITVGDHGYLLI